MVHYRDTYLVPRVGTTLGLFVSSAELLLRFFVKRQVPIFISMFPSPSPIEVLEHFSSSVGGGGRESVYERVRV